MFFLDSLFPDLELDSAYDVDYEGLYEKGYRGVIFDIDNTLVPHGDPADEKSIALFSRLKKIGFDTVLLSNNKEYRVKPFADAVGSKYEFLASKPSRKGYERAMADMGTDKDSTLFVGDQIFTDVWGAKRTGIYAILTKKILPREEIQIVLKRFLEKIVLFFYHRKLKREGK